MKSKKTPKAKSTPKRKAANRTLVTDFLPGMSDPKIESLRKLAVAYIDAKKALSKTRQELQQDLADAQQDLLNKMHELKRTDYHNSELGVTVHVKKTEKEVLSVYAWEPIVFPKPKAAKKDKKKAVIPVPEPEPEPANATY